MGVFDPIYRYDIIQNSDEWFEIKVGMFSASIAADLLMSKTTKGYCNLIKKITEERITGERCESSQFKGNWATERGHRFEPIAREDYELRNIEVVDLIGVVIKDKWCLCSPDGLIGNDKLHQIKCPIFSTHKEYLDDFKLGKFSVPGNYYKQMQFELFVTGREINIFTSFHPNLKPIDIEISRDIVLIDQIENRIGEAKEEILKEIEIIKNY